MNLKIDNKDLGYLSEAVQYRLFTINRELESLTGSTAEYDQYMKDALTENYNRLARLSNTIDKARHVQDITEDANKETIGNNIDEYIEAPLVIDGNAEATIETVTKQMQECFTNYGKVKTDEEIKALIEKQGGFKVND